MELTEEQRAFFRTLADKYETPAFSAGDPCRILTRYTEQADIEAGAFIAAMLAFGRREHFLPKTEAIMTAADKAGGIAAWLKTRAYKHDFMPPANSAPADYEKKFYRFYSYGDFIKLFDALALILNESQMLGAYFERAYKTALAASDASNIPLAPIIASAFDGCAVVPRGKNSANKRTNMFLRWMVRRNSPVDLGLWTWYEPANLIIPLDTHVVRQSIRFGLIPPKSGGTLKTALALTEVLKQVWRDDPCKGDFALYGLGIDSTRENT
ncbi:MAG: TIGR02757 family protein [Treponema sp.]